MVQNNPVDVEKYIVERDGARVSKERTRSTADDRMMVWPAGRQGGTPSQQQCEYAEYSPTPFHHQQTPRRRSATSTRRRQELMSPYGRALHIRCPNPKAGERSMDLFAKRDHELCKRGGPPYGRNAEEMTSAIPVKSQLTTPLTRIISHIGKPAEGVVPLPVIKFACR
jgi:hypothetical protein